MIVTKNQITKGISNFVDNEIIPNIPEKNVKTIVGGMVIGALAIPGGIEKILDNAVMQMIFVKKDDNTYELQDQFITSAKQAFHKYGGMDITIPANRFLVKEEKTLSFDESDIEKLITYIKEG